MGFLSDRFWLNPVSKPEFGAEVALL
jgi:hypothetical protein